MSLRIYRDGPGWTNSHVHRWRWTKAAVKFADDTGPPVRQALSDEAPKKTGSLALSIRYRRNTQAGDGVQLFFETPKRYAKWVIGGAAPHGIEPVAARFLHFFWEREGRWFVRGLHVNHPGIERPNDFPARVLEAKRDDIERNFSRAVEDSFKE